MLTQQKIHQKCTHVGPYPGSAGGESSGSGKGGSSLALQPGDVVEVVEGDLMNLQGKVISVEMDTVTIMPKHEDLKVIVCYTCSDTHTYTLDVVVVCQLVYAFNLAR